MTRLLKASLARVLPITTMTPHPIAMAVGSSTVCSEAAVADSRVNKTMPAMVMATAPHMGRVTVCL